jgi:photosystem II stability/assembly factor-like uncharacterized protein
MNKKGIFSSIGLLFAIGTLYMGARALSSFNVMGQGEHPGYYDQWFAEKKDASGKIPSWQYAKWAAWDRMQVKSRGTEDIIDTVLQMGPAAIGGRTRSIWIDPRNDQVILAAAISGGVWRSENGGEDWTPINDQETSLMASCIVHNPFNPDIVYYGTGEGRANSADVDGNGIYKSTDGGKTFQVLSATVGLSGFSTIWDIKHSFTDSLTFFVGTHTRGVFRTIDGGKTFEQVLGTGSLQANSLLVLPNDRVLVGMYTNQIYASDSSGKKGTFKTVPITGWPGSGVYGRVQLANCRNFPNVVYALLEGYGFNDAPAGFFKSSNGGKTWIKQTAPTNIGSGYQTYCVMLGVSPVDTNVAVAGGVYIGQTNDGGKNWISKNVGHADHHAMSPFYSNTGFFLVGTDGGIYKYRYTSANVQETLNTGYYVTQFYAGNFGPNDFASIGGTQDNGTHVATAKLTSQKYYGADGAYAHIGLQDGKIAYFSTQNQGIRRIQNFNPAFIPSFTDGIDDARFATDGVNFINAYAMNPADQMQLYYRTNKYLYRSVDGGDSWDPITNLRSQLKAIGISAEENPVVYTGGGAAQLYRIDKAVNANPGGEVSYNNAFPASITSDFLNSIAVHPNDRYCVFISFSNYSTQPRVWRISGLNSANPVFKNVSGNLPPGLPVNYVAVDPAYPEKNLFAGTDFGLYYSTDSGTTWVKELRIPNVAVHEIKMRKDRTLFIYTHGRGMWYLQLKPTGTNAVKNPLKALVKVYPNPASEQVHIRFEGNQKPADVMVYSMAGAALETFKFNGESAVLNVSEYTAGFYFIKVLRGSETFTERIHITH